MRVFVFETGSSLSHLKACVTVLHSRWEAYLKIQCWIVVVSADEKSVEQKDMEITRQLIW